MSIIFLLGNPYMKFQNCIFINFVMDGLTAGQTQSNMPLGGIKIAGVTDYTNQTPPKYFTWIKCLSKTALNNEKIFIKCAQIRITHVQCMNNHYAKFEN